MQEPNYIDRKSAYKKLKSALCNDNPEKLEGLDAVIQKLFSGVLSSRLVAIMQSGKVNIDDETYELNRRCRLASIHWKFSRDTMKDLVVFFENSQV